MHISLDQALGRQPRLNRVGQSLLNIASGASAAYSLRSLTGGDPRVVRVRRSSDNAEQDFTASEVSGGALAAYVGAGNDGFVATWYDQSGNGNDASQSTQANQPKIVNSGTTLDHLLFDGTDVFDEVSLSSTAQPATVFSVSSSADLSTTGGVYGVAATGAGYYRASTDKHAIFMGGTGGATLEGSTYVVDTDYLRFDLFNTSSSAIGINGATATTGTTGNNNITRIQVGDSNLGGVNPINGTIKEIVLYLSDQSSNRTAIEANINGYYDIYS